MEAHRVAILGLATSVGGVPFDDVDPAVAFALRAHDRFPTVPVLRRCDRSLLALAVAGVPGIGLSAGPSAGAVSALTVAAGGLDPTAAGDLDALTATNPGALDPLDRVVVGAPEDAAAVRLGVLGPVTLALALRSAGLPLEAAVDGAVALVRSRGAALLGRIGSLRADLPVVLVLTEPGLVGSVHPTFPLGRQVVREHLLGPVVDALAAASPADGMVGVHVPGRTDWETVIGAGPAFVSLPAGPDVASWASSIRELVAAGGVLAWGAVPVNRPLGVQADPLWRALAATFAALAAEGVDPVALRFQSLVSPVDGLAGFDPVGAGRVVDLCTDLSSRLRRQSLATRLSLGA